MVHGSFLEVLVYILDKNKDFYDYMGSIYGVDKGVTYDRRGSVVMTDFSLLKHVVDDHVHAYWKEKKTDFFVVEVGDVQHLFGITDVKYGKSISPSLRGDPISGDIRLIKSFKEHHHYFEKEITLVPVRHERPYGWWRQRGKTEFRPEVWSELVPIMDHAIPNPILRDTTLAGLLDAKEMWIDLSNYISSKYNDKTIEIVNSDVDKIINHGFDKKTSFRNPIK